jgi:lysophospholipase L1-like esterase
MARMKKQIFAAAFAGACICLGAIPASAQTIMPMGDSVTARGSDPESSYRYWLWQKLQDAGYTGVTFVGNQYGVSDGTPANTDFDQHYENGGPENDGWSTQDGVDNEDSAAAMTPNIVLLDLGSNDILQGIPTDTTEANLEQIIQAFAAQNPGVVILLAVPTGFVPDPGLSRQEQNQEKSQQSKLSGVIGKVVSTEKKAGVNVIKVDLFNGFNARKDTVDGTHPNIQGEQKIADKYFNEIKKVLKKM